MFWQIMGPKARRRSPTGKLAEAINGAFGSFDQFKEKFNAAGAEAASAPAGPGWSSDAGKLELISTANQDSPLMEGKHARPGRSTCGSTPTT